MINLPEDGKWVGGKACGLAFGSAEKSSLCAKLALEYYDVPIE